MRTVALLLVSIVLWRIVRTAHGATASAGMAERNILSLLQEAALLQQQVAELPPGMRKLMQPSAGLGTGMGPGMGPGPGGGPGGRPNAPLANADLNQLAIRVAELRVLSEAIGLASGIISIVYGSLNTATSALSLSLSTYTLTTSPLTFYISEYTFGQGLYNDGNRLIDGSDYLGDAAKYIKLYNRIRDLLGADQAGWFQDQMAQMASVQNILEAAGPAFNDALTL